MTEDLVDWMDVALRPLGHDDRTRLLSEFQVALDSVEAGAQSWIQVANASAHWSARAMVEGDMPGCYFWAHATREFSDRQSILELTSPRLSES